jgi:hypothetical protein
MTAPKVLKVAIGVMGEDLARKKGKKPSQASVWARNGGRAGAAASAAKARQKKEEKSRG